MSVGELNQEGRAVICIISGGNVDVRQLTFCAALSIFTNDRKSLRRIYVRLQITFSMSTNSQIQNLGIRGINCKLLIYVTYMLIAVHSLHISCLIKMYIAISAIIYIFIDKRILLTTHSVFSSRIIFRNNYLK